MKLKLIQMRNIFYVVIFFALTFQAFGQGVLKGQVRNEKNELIDGVKIKGAEGKTSTAFSDMDGNYTLRIKDSSAQTIEIVLELYDTLYFNITVTNGDTVIHDFSLIKTKISDAGGGDVIVVRGISKAKNTDKTITDAGSSIEIIDNKTSTRNGDGDVAKATARSAGVATTGTGLITVRGIGDRYIKTTLNGSRIPTLDPLTNNLKLDIFPTSLVENIIITKTVSPELPGDWSGAYLSVETKEFPNKLEVTVDSQFGYNAQSSFKDVITSQRSSTDFLGFDNGVRNRKDDAIVSPNLTPTTYQEMVALGLGDYYNSLGVTGWTDGSTQSDTYFRLGLVQLGLLPQALINDQSAYLQAKNEYNTDYKPMAFENINPEGKDYSNGFSNNWNTTKRKAPLNFTQSFSIGDKDTLFGRQFGYLIGFRYGNSVRFDPNGISQRIGAEELNYPVDLRDNTQISRETNGWNGLVNLSYKLNKQNKVSFMFMPNFLGTNDVASYSTQPMDPVYEEGRVQKNQFYEQRKQMVYQFKTDHTIDRPIHKIKISTNASYTQGNSIAPDFKVIQYGYVKNNSEISSYFFSPTSGDGIRRYYRYLNENIFDSRIGIDVPFGDTSKHLERKLKFGGAYQRTDRKSDLNEFYMIDGNNPSKDQLASDDINAYLNPNRFIMTNHQIDFFYSERDFARNHSYGFSSVKAAFILADYEVKSNIRFYGGVRVEQAKIFSDIDEYNRLGYERNDLRRENLGGFPVVNAANINEINVLPSANLIYKILETDSTKRNMRFNYSQTVARPSIRELNDAAVYDNEFRTLIYGNSDLKVVHIKNFDYRFESYFKNKDNITVSLFYKDFRNHIEMGFGSSGITWQNIDKSNVMGIELDGKKSITKYLEVRANVTFVKSNSVFIRKDMEIIDGVKVFTPIDTINRPMFGQAPFIVNTMMTFKLDEFRDRDSIGLTATLSYNVQGPRLVITGVVKGRPDVYEMPRNTIDFKVSKTIGNYFTASLSIRDMLNTKVRRAYKLPTGWADYDSFRYGTNFIVGISYKL